MYKGSEATKLIMMSVYEKIKPKKKCTQHVKALETKSMVSWILWRDPGSRIDSASKRH
jgi:hypothetical protein